MASLLFGVHLGIKNGTAQVAQIGHGFTSITVEVYRSVVLVGSEAVWATEALHYGIAAAPSNTLVNDFGFDCATIAKI